MACVIFRPTRRIFRGFILSAVFLAGPIIGPAATTYYVAPTGNDSNPGTLASPWRTLAKAVSGVSSGDTVYLRAGTWNEKLWVSGKNYASHVTFQNYPGESPVLDGTGITLQYEEGVIQALNSSYIRVQGLRVQNSPNAGLDIFRSHHVEYLNNTTWNTKKSGIGLWYANDCLVRGNNIGLSNNLGSEEPVSVAAGSYNIEVSYNTVHHGASIPDGYAGGEGINIKDGCHDVYVHHNVVHLDDRPDGKPSNRYAFGVDAWSRTTYNIHFYNNIAYNNAIGIVVESEAGGTADGVWIYNNVFYNNNVAGFYMPTWAQNESSLKKNVHVYNNTFNNNRVGALINTSKVENLILRNNIFTNDASAAISLGSAAPISQLTQDHNLTSGDPLFVNASGGDFHLQSGSPAIDAGIAVSSVTNDFDGLARPQGTACDIGAYEYSGTSPALSASAAGNPTSGQAPLAVSFSGSASGGTSPYTYSWTFGDGGTSTSQNPSHTYTSTAAYTATLTVRDSAAATATRSVAVTVTAAASPLAAGASASPTSGQAPLAVSFAGSGSGGVTPYTYSWAFGDGGTSTSQNPSHTYTASGTFTATLTIRDNVATTATRSVTLTVTSAPAQLAAAASANPTSGQSPLPVAFTGTASGGTPPYTYRWSFGDGATANSQNPAHTYTADGNYVATLTATDNTATTVTSAIAISVISTTTATLSISEETGAPAPGDGGTTNPAAGDHSYPVGTSVKVDAVPLTDYRFSKWGGDVAEASVFNAASTLDLNANKSVLATFCAKCADINGDLKITPADAQAAFDLYLKRITNPTWCQLENADVNCSGTKLEPRITPADAQAIFNKYLKRGTGTFTCSGSDRATTASLLAASLSNGPFLIDSSFLTSEGDIFVPIIVESGAVVGAFGFDLSFPSDSWTYIGLQPADLTAGCEQLAGELIPYEKPAAQGGQAAAPGGRFLRVGGYKTNPAGTPSVGVLVMLVFRAKAAVLRPSEISILAAYDDLRNALISAGTTLAPGNAGRRDENRQPADKRGGKILSK